MPLTYCLNIHPGESWTENLETLRTTVPRVRDLVTPGQRFGLGLRLSAAAAEELGDPARMTELKRLLDTENFYAFTINGFPYGRFHGGPVKENVYAPDWRDAKRRDYTNRLADILAALTPQGGTGTISTVPCSWKGWIHAPSEIPPMLDRLTSCVAHCAGIQAREQRTIVLTLEPEPGCLLETTAETIAFFTQELFTRGATILAAKLRVAEDVARDCIRRHLGVCLDTCHVALQYEDPLESLMRYREAGIRVPKIQVSSALRTDASPKALEALRAFVEPVYLHQVIARTPAGKILQWNDLPAALEALPDSGAEEVRVHFHVPLHFTGAGVLGSTGALLTREFLTEIASDPALHLEIETYTWDVLPPALRSTSVEESISKEFQWLGLEV